MTERPDFQQQFVAVADRLGPGLLSHQQAARELAIGYATLKRLLDAKPIKPELDKHESPMIEYTYAEVPH